MSVPARKLASADDSLKCDMAMVGVGALRAVPNAALMGAIEVHTHEFFNFLTHIPTSSHIFIDHGDATNGSAAAASIKSTSPR